MPRDRVTVAERRLHALALRREGHPYDVIARLVGVSRARAWQLVQEALSARTIDEVDALRLLEGERLDAAQQAIWSAVLDGNFRAVDTFVRLSARRARLFGLDVAPDDIVVAMEMRQAYQQAMNRMMTGIDSMLAEEAH